MVSFGWVAVITGAGPPLLLFALSRQRGAMQASSLLFVLPGITALSAWPILGTPVGPTALMGFAVATCGLRLASVSHERQVGDPDAEESQQGPPFPASKLSCHWETPGSLQTIIPAAGTKTANLDSGEF